MKKFSIGKIGGKGAGLSYEELVALFKYILSDKEPGTQLILVVSALEMTTRNLQYIFNEKLNGDAEKAWERFQEIKMTHVQRCTDLFISKTDILFDLFHEIEYFILHGSINGENPTISEAQLLRFGELMSSEIINQFLIKENIAVKLIDAQKMIFASGENYCYSEPLQPKTSEMISRFIETESDYDDTIILTQGYICNERLLGLDGSDLTASLIAYGLQLCIPTCFIEKISFWKNVDGVIVDGVVKDRIGSGEYDSLDKGPVRKDAISLNKRYKPKTIIRSFINLEHSGTLIVWD